MITCEEYHDRNKKNAAYHEIATEMGISLKYRVDTLLVKLMQFLKFQMYRLKKSTKELTTCCTTG